LNASGRVDDNLDQTRVLLDGMSAPLLFAQSRQINAVVPYAVAGKSIVRVEVEFLGVRSEPVTVPVADSASSRNDTVVPPAHEIVGLR